MAGVKKQNMASSSILKRHDSERKRSFVPGVKKPLPEPSSVKHVLLMIVMHVCRKVILYEPEMKVCVYLGALLCGSLVSDFLPVPRSYFSQKSNFFNQYFVKWGWGWTLLCLGAYLGFTSYVYCCGDVIRVRRHFYRLGVGTFTWFFWTKLFVAIEGYTAACMNAKFTTKAVCNRHGYAWAGFDISGHAFLLIYCSLIISEEAKSVRGWERIGELIRNKVYEEDSPLKQLSKEEMEHLQRYYVLFTPYVRSAFILLTLLSILWDVMLVATILYFHHMVHKVIGGIIAIFMWFITYRWYYTLQSSPGLPGQGLFKYSDSVPFYRRVSLPGYL